MATAKPLLFRPLFLLARRLRRVGFVCGRLAFPALRLSTAAAFLFVTLATPFSQARAQSRASFSSRQYDEFSTSREDGDYFSPDRLRQRLHTLDTMVEGLNNRFARLQGRSPDRGSSENLTPQVFQAALERFQAAAQFSSEIEMKRAQFSQTLASAGGFQFRSYPDGRRMWFKNGRVHRIENEKITDGQGRVSHQDVVDMAYDQRGNLLSSKTILRDADGHLTTKNWAGTYADGSNGKSVLASFAETTWDPLGNETKIERTGLTYGDGGKNPISYRETTTDKYGQTSRRTVTGASYDGDGNLLSFHEDSEENGVAQSKDWSGAAYQKYQRDGKDAWRLTSYTETTTDAQGRQSRREWGGATYDENNSLKSYTQKDTDPAGESRVLAWSGARYDARGNVSEFSETVTGPAGESRRTWRGGQYDAHGRLTGFEELNIDAQGVSTSRRWSGADYNAKGDLLGYRETNVDGHGLESVRTWTAGSYENGRLTAYSESIVDDRGHAAVRRWNGRFDPDHRLASFSEESTDALGNVTRRGQEGLTYDSLGRALAYGEWTEDAFGQRTSSRWTAAGYDVKDRLTGYQLIETLSSGRAMTTVRSAMTYDAAGRLTQYDEDLTARGGYSPDAQGRQTVRVLSFDAFGQATLTQTTVTNALGEVTERTHQAEYDGRGRLASTSDTLRSADGSADVARWSVDAFDEYDRATATREITGAGEGEKTKVWSGRFDSKGLTTESTETTTDARGLSVTTRLTDAVYNAQGRLTDSLQVTQRTDLPGVTIETRTSERTYDRAGAVAGGREVTRTTGEWNGQPLEATTVRRTEEAVLADGYVTGYRQTVLTTGVSDGRSLHTQEETLVALGAKGDRTETTHRLAFGKDETLETDAYSTLRRTNLVADLAGRALSYTEERSDDFSPRTQTTTRRENRYSAAGVLTGFTEDSVDGLGLRTRSETTGLVENAAGQLIASRERIAHPGQTVAVDEIAKSEMAYSPLGQLASYREQTLSTGPGLSSATDARKTLGYDGAGRVAVSAEEGVRNGAAYTSNTFHVAFDLKGRAVHSVEESTGPGGPSNIERSNVAFDEFGRRVSYHEEGVSGGSMVHQTIATEYDALGREAATESTGFRESGAFHERSETTGFNDLGQSTGRRVTGRSASEGDYAYSQTAQVYGLAGDLISFDKERTDADGTTRSHWASKGVDARGRSLGFTETGSVSKDGQPAYDFTTEQTAGAFTRQNQSAAYDAVTVKRFANGATETAATHWTDGAYDAQGRLTGFKETQTTTLTDNGETKTSSTSRVRESAAYYEDDGPGHLKGQLASTVDVLLDDLSPEKTRRVRTTGMTYDAEGRSVGGETTTGEVNRLKDALRRVADLLGGGAKAGGNILTGLRQLLENTAGLTSDVVAWAKDNVVSPSQDFLEGLGAWLADLTGGKTAANPALDREVVSELVYRIHEKAGGADLSEIPAGFQSAAAALGTFDQTLTMTRAVDKVFDAQGRAAVWREIALSASAPDRPAVTDVRVTYKDNSRLLSTYAARTVEGDKVTQLFRDHYTYDALNRGLYREATFDGEDLSVLSVDQGGVSTTGAQWGALKDEARSLLLSDILEGRTEIVGKVAFKQIDEATFDAAGNMLDIFGTRTTRGFVLSDFAQGQALPSDYGAMVDSALKTAQAEYDEALASQKEVADLAQAQATQREADLPPLELAAREAADRLSAANTAKEDALARLATAELRKAQLDAAISQFRTDHREIARSQPDGLPSVTTRDYVKDGNSYRDTLSTWNIKVLRFDEAGHLIQTLVYRTETKTTLASARPSDPPVSVNMTETDAAVGTRMGGWYGGFRSGTVILKVTDDDSVWADKINNGNDRNLNGVFVPWLNISAIDSLKRLADLYRNRARATDDIDRSKTDLEIAAKRIETERTDLTKADQALTLARSALVAAQNASQSVRAEYDALYSLGRADMETKKAEMADRFQTNAAALAKTLSGLDLLLNGSLRLTEADALALVTRGAFDHAGQSLSLAALSSAKVKTSLNNEEHFAQLSAANSQKSVSLSWQGDLKLNGSAATPGALSAVLTPSALAAAPAADGSVAGLSVAEGGRLTIHRTLAQTQDAAGRVTSQNTETLNLSRTNGKTTSRRTLQDASGQQFDARGQLVGYVRTTREEGKDPVVETLTGADYDDSGRQISSDIRVTESSPNGIQTRNVHTDVLSFNAAGQAVRSRRVVDSGGQMTVTQDLADTVFDGEGRAVFALSESVGTSREAWERAGGNFAALTGERTRSAGWTTAFDDRGQALTTLRVSTPNPDGTARHFVIETNQNTYDDAGRLALSTTDTTEFGHDPKTRSSLYKSGREERRTLSFAAGGQALRERITRTENGLTSVSEDEADRVFDAQGRVVQTQTVTTDAQGLKTHFLWKALSFDADGRSLRFERTTTDAAGLKTVERSAEDAAYDDRGRLTAQSLDVTEWNDTGAVSRLYRKTEDQFDYDGFGRVLSLRQTTDKTDANGAFVRDAKTIAYRYDQRGRAINTWTDGIETAGGQSREYHYGTVVLSFDAQGRNARTRTTTLQDGLRTDRFSTADISYDALGRVLKSRDLVHQWGVGLDAYTSEETTNNRFDDWGRAVDSLSVTINGALKTESHSHDLVFDADGRLARQTIDIHESSTLPGIELSNDRTIAQTEMRYDAIGNLIGYKKVITEGGLETTYSPALLQYDGNGRSVVSLERVTDNFDRDEIIGNVGSQYNVLGQLIGGQSVTVKGRPDTLSSKQLLGMVAAIQNGDLQSAKGQALVKSLGLEGLSANRTVSPNRYDTQGRLVFTDTLMDKAGWALSDVAKTEVLFDQTITRGDAWWYDAQLRQRTRALEAQGFTITNKTFKIEGNTSDHRYCFAAVTYTQQVKTYKDTHERSTNAITAFDALNRPISQTIATLRGATTTVNRQSTAYDAQGRVASLDSRFEETGINGDGSALDRRFNQQQSFTYDAAGRSVAERTRTWGDTAAPLKDTTSTIDQIVYDKGQRVAWSETTTSNERTQQNVRRMSSVSYDGLGRIAAYDADTFEGEPGALRLQYSDRDARNTYDALSRLVLTLGQRSWGTARAPQGAPALLSSPATVGAGVPGGGVQGLSEGWTSGAVALAIAYEYANGSSSISGQWVTAHGTGFNAEDSVRAAGINLNHHEYGMRYDSVGRVIAYKVASTQIEKYDYYKQGQKGLKRSIKKGSATGAVTTVSDVVFTEFDGFGRTVRSVTESQRNDLNHTWTRTETLVKSFDTNGRALDVERHTDSKMTVAKSRGGLGGAITKAMGKAGSWMLAAIMPLMAPLTASGSLGGQKMYSSSIVSQRMAYRLDGTVDESRTTTDTLSQSSYLQGKNMGDTMMQVTDVLVAVAAVVVAVAATIAAGATGGAGAPAAAAAWKTAALCVTVAAAGYRTMRSGISAHDLQLFGKDRDRAESRQNSMNFVSGWGSVAVAGVGTWMKTANFFTKGAEVTGAMNTLGRNTLIALEVGVQMVAAQAGGADAKTMWGVGALTVATNFVNNGFSGEGGGSKMSGLQGLIAIAGSAAQNIGMTFGKSNQRTTWMLVGSAAQGAAYAKSSEMNSSAIQAGLKGYLVNLYASKNDGSGLTDLARARRGMLVDGLGQLGGALVGHVLSGAHEAISEGIDRFTGKFERMKETLENNPEMARQFLAEAGVASVEELPYSALKAASQSINEAWAKRPLEMYLSDRKLDLWSGGIKANFLLEKDTNGSISSTNEYLLERADGLFELSDDAVIKVGGRQWIGGSLFRQTDSGLEIIAGTAIVSSFKGVVAGPNAEIPVDFQQTSDGRLLGELATDHLGAGSRYRIISPTRVKGLGLVHAGQIGIDNNGRAIPLEGTLYSPKGGIEARYVLNHHGIKLNLQAQMTKEGFVAYVDHLALPGNLKVAIQKTVLLGKIENGSARLGLGQERRDLAITLMGAETKAGGKINLRLTTEGIEFEGVARNALLQYSDSPTVGPPNSKSEELSKRSIPASHFMILDSKGSDLRLFGDIAITEAGTHPFAPLSEWTAKDGVSFQRDNFLYFQNKAPGQFRIDGSGLFIAPSGSGARNTLSNEIRFFGHNGTVAALASWDKGGQLASVVEPQSGLPLSGRVITSLTGQRTLVVEGLKGLHFETLLTAKESRTHRLSVWGATATVNSIHRLSKFIPGSNASLNLAQDGLVSATPLAARFGRNAVAAIGLILHLNARTLGADDWENPSQIRRVTGWVPGTMSFFEDIAVRGEHLAQANRLALATNLDLGNSSSLDVANQSFQQSAAEALVNLVGLRVNPLGFGLGSTDQYEKGSGLGNVGSDLLKLPYGVRDIVTFKQTRDEYREFGGTVAFGSGAINSLMLGGLVIGSGKGGARIWERAREGWTERMGASSGRFRVYSDLRRGVRALQFAAPDIVAETGRLAGLDGGTEFINHIRERIVEKNFAGIRAAIRDTGLHSQPGLSLMGVEGKKVTVWVNGEGARLLSAPEIAHFNSVLREKGYWLDIGVSDRAAFKAFEANKELKYALSREGLANVRYVAKAERTMAVGRQRKALAIEQRYSTEEIDLKGQADKKQAHSDSLENQRSNIQAVLAERGRIPDNVFVEKIKNLIPDFDPNGRDRRSPGGPEGRQEIDRRRSGHAQEVGREVRRPGEKIGPDARELGRDGQRLQEVRRGVRGYSEAGRIETEAGRIETEAGRVANEEIGRLGGEIERLKSEIADLRGRQAESGSRAGINRGRAGKIAERIERYDRQLTWLQERIEKIQDPLFLKSADPRVTITLQMDKSQAHVGSLLDQMETETQGNPSYAPYPFLRAPPKPGNLLTTAFVDRAPPADVFIAKGSLSQAESLLKGIDTSRLNPDTRDGRAIYTALKEETAAKEIGFHGQEASHFLKARVNWEAVKAADFHDPAVRDKLGFVDGDNYELTNDAAQRARMLGYNAVWRDSLRDPGQPVLAVLDDFNTIFPDKMDVLEASPELQSLSRVTMQSRPFWRSIMDRFYNEKEPVTKSLGAAAARDFGDPANTKYEIVRPQEPSTSLPEVTGPSARGIGLPNASLRQRLLNFIFGQKIKSESVSPNVSAEGPPSNPLAKNGQSVVDDLDNSLGYVNGKPMETPEHLKTFKPGENLPFGGKAGQGPGTASLSEYIEATLNKSEVISQGPLGFDPAFESKASAESGMVGLSKSGLESFRVLREAGIRVSVGSEAAWGELNAAGTTFIKEVFNSPTRTNKLTTTSDGTRFLDITDNNGRTVRATEKGDFVGFIVDRPEALPQWNPKALPPSRAGPQSKTNLQILVSGNRVKYTPINPGPLPKEIASTFRSATYEAVKLDQPAELYRVFSDPSKKMGPYWTIKKPESSLKAIVDSALDPNWGNRATDIVSIRVPAGETIYIGPAASQRALVGGVDQIYIDQVNPLWEIKK